MKNVVKVSIGHWAFTLEESAYQFLEAYLTKLKAYYNNAEKAELAEERIGEYLADRVKTVNQVVEDSLLKDAIKSLGLPDFLTDNSEETFSADESKADNFSRKRLFRDPDRKVLGGVFGGLGAYFNIDPVGIRLIYSILFLVSIFGADGWAGGFFGFLLFLYLILWICVPMAKTSEEKRRMHASNADEDVKRVANVFANRAKDVAEEARTSSFAHFVAEFFRILFGVIFILVGTTGLFTLPILIWITPIDFLQIFDVFSTNGAFVLCKIFITIVAFIPFLILLYEGVKMLFKLNIKKIHLGWLLFIIWLASLIGLAISSAIEFRPYVSTAISTGTIEDTDYMEQDLPMTSDTLYVDIASDALYDGETYACVLEDFYFFWQKNGNEKSVIVLPELRMMETSDAPSVRTKTKLISRDPFGNENKIQRLQESVKYENNTISIAPQIFHADDPWSLEQIDVDIFVPHGSTVILRFGNKEESMRKGSYYPFVGYEKKIQDCTIRSVVK